MKNIITQYSGLKREIYVLFVGKMVTAMGSFVWPMLTFLLTTKLGFTDGVATLLIATAGLVSLPMALRRQFRRHGRRSRNADTIDTRNHNTAPGTSEGMGQRKLQRTASPRGLYCRRRMDKRQSDTAYRQERQRRLHYSDSQRQEAASETQSRTGKDTGDIKNATAKRRWRKTNIYLPKTSYHIGVKGADFSSRSFTQPVAEPCLAMSSFSTGAPGVRTSRPRSIQSAPVDVA